MKLKRLFSGLLVSLIAIVSVLLCVKVSNAAETTVSKNSFSAVSGSLDSVVSYTTAKNDSGTAPAIYGNEIRLYQRNDKEGTKGGSITISVTEGSTMTSVVIGSSMKTTISYKIDDGSMSSNTSLAEGAKFTLSDISATCVTFYCMGTDKNSRLYVNYLGVTYNSENATTYNVSFDANGTSFAEGKGDNIEVENGARKQVILPTIDDLVYTYKNSIILDKWSDGTNDYEPGSTVEVSKGTTFTASYKEDNSKVLSVYDAVELAKHVGKTGTTLQYQVFGVIKEFDSKYPDTFTIVDEDDATKKIKIFNPKTKVADSYVVVGDKVLVSGQVLNYNNKTPEINAGCTYTNVSMFQRVETMSSLSFDWATTDGETYTVSNVSLRFGNLFRAVAFDSNAQYGVFVIKSSVLGTSTVEQYLSGKTLAEINADANVCNAVATPVKVNAQGVADEKGKYYQFAAVLSDMDEYLTTSITAVMYVVIDGQIYYSVEKTASVQSTAYAYFNDDALMNTLDKDVQKVILKLATL